jgi:hypothetical protein
MDPGESALILVSMHPSDQQKGSMHSKSDDDDDEQG